LLLHALKILLFKCTYHAPRDVAKYAENLLNKITSV